MSVSPIDHVRTVHSAQRVADHLGSHFFDAAAMRFFDSRILSDFYVVESDVNTAGGSLGYFVTSERYDETTPRGYTVRSFRVTPYDGGRGLTDHKVFVDTVGEFQEYESAREAKRAAEVLAATKRNERASVA